MLISPLKYLFANFASYKPEQHEPSKYSDIKSASEKVEKAFKAIRILIFVKQGVKELKKLVHPNSVLPLKVGNKIINQEIKDSVWGFLAVYMITLLLGTMLLLASGLSFETSFSAVFSCINNLGPALGEATFNYDSLNQISKLFLSFAMILGSLEIYTLLVLFTSFFWRS